MTVNVEKKASETVIAIVGRVDTVTAPALEKVIKENESDSKLVLDMNSVEYISSAGLRVLLCAQKNAKDGAMKLINVPKDVMEVFEMTGFADILTIE